MYWVPRQIVTDSIIFFESIAFLFIISCLRTFVVINIYTLTGPQVALGRVVPKTDCREININQLLDEVEHDRIMKSQVCYLPKAEVDNTDTRFS